MTEPENTTEPVDELGNENIAEGLDGVASSIPVEELDAAEILIPGSIEDMTQKLADAEKQTLIARADLENYRKRARRDMQDQLKYAPMKLMMEMLEAVDNLDRAIESAGDEAQGSGLLEGVKMVATQISGVLESHGCKKIEAIGQPFDPNFHQAVQMQASEEHDEGTVMMETRTGFQLHDRVIRPAQVFVSTGPAKE